jgi:hypothetical protein
MEEVIVGLLPPAWSSFVDRFLGIADFPIPVRLGVKLNSFNYRCAMG